MAGRLCPCPLSAFARRERLLSTAHRTAARLQAGTVFVNCVLLADPAFPFGGMKMSGIGRENGSEVLDAYLEPKSVIVSL